MGGRKKRKKKPSSGAGGGGASELVHELLVSGGRGDLKHLRQVAVVRGLGGNGIRKYAWPLLVGLGATAPGADVIAGEEGHHRDVQVVDVDVQRCLFRDADKRPALRRVLNACVCNEIDLETKEQGVYYYQGLHDIASVILLVVGDEEATLAIRESPLYSLLLPPAPQPPRTDADPPTSHPPPASPPLLDFRKVARLVKDQLRDCTRSDLVPVLESLELVFDLLRALDPELHDHIRSSGVPCHFALSWRLTWFSHDTQTPAQCSRLFDAFMASPPLFPLYVGACAIASRRELVMNTEPDFATMHTLLSSINSGGVGSISEGDIRRALQLYKSAPPERLVAGSRGKGKGGMGYLKYLRTLGSAGGWGGDEADGDGGGGKAGRRQYAWAWSAMLGFSGLAAVTTATAAITSIVAFWDGNLEFQLV